MSLPNFQIVLSFFYGYSIDETKDFVHNNRSKGLIGRDVFFNENTQFCSKKELFLSIPVNKQKYRRKKCFHLKARKL